MISVTAWSPSVAGQVLKLLLPVKIRGKQDSYLNSSSLHLKDKLLLGDFKLHFKLICFLCWSWQLWYFCLTKMDQGRGLSSSCSLLLLYICKYLSIFFFLCFFEYVFCLLVLSICGLKPRECCLYKSSILLFLCPILYIPRIVFLFGFCMSVHVCQYQVHAVKLILLNSLLYMFEWSCSFS